MTAARKFRGGVRGASFHASWPFCVLHLVPDGLLLEVPVRGPAVLPRESIRKIQRMRGVVSSGIRIESSSYAEPVTLQPLFGEAGVVSSTSCARTAMRS